MPPSSRLCRYGTQTLKFESNAPWTELFGVICFCCFVDVVVVVVVVAVVVVVGSGGGDSLALNTKPLKVNARYSKEKIQNLGFIVVLNNSTSL